MIKNLISWSLILISAIFAPTVEGAKIYQLIDARVYLKDGTVNEYSGDAMLSMPYKKDALQKVENPYTKKQKKNGEIASATVDSVVTWLPTHPEKHYTFVYLPKYGWSTILDKAPQSTSYLYSDGGYRIRPDGGLWFFDTQKLIVERDGAYKDLKNPYNMSVEKFAEKVAAISGGDASLESRLKQYLGREQSDNYVRVVKINGDTIFGYLHNDVKTIAKNLFSKSGSLLQYINISEEPDSKATRYSADEVSEIQWFNNHLAPNTRVSMSMHSPLMFKFKHYTRGFTWLWDRRPGGSIVKWEAWDTTGGKNPVRRLVPVVSVYFEGTKGAFILYYNNSVSLSQLYHYMKEAAPEFHAILNEYYDNSPDWKAHRKELKDNPSTILALYEDYLQTHDCINDRPNAKVSDDEKEEEKANK